ncbi:hypothetical protein D9M73_202430 [compost metagenome]
MLEIKVSVDLRGGDVGMAEHLLHGAQVLGRFEQVAGKRVPQHVRVQVLAQLTFAGSLYAQLDRPRTESTALAADEHGVVLWCADAA